MSGIHFGVRREDLKSFRELGIYVFSHFVCVFICFLCQVIKEAEEMKQISIFCFKLLP